MAETTNVDVCLPKLTPAAEKKAAELLAREDRDDLCLRLSVSPGGCSGLIYSLAFMSNRYDGDAEEEYDGVTLVIDRMSQPYLTEATIDFVDQIDKQGFQIHNEKNTKGTCACGDSFY